MKPYWVELFYRLQEGEAVDHPLREIKALAIALAPIYGLGAKLRRRLYTGGWRKVKCLPIPVVSVGNLAVGGTGKTPLVACLARRFQGQGKRVAILSRGYGGRAHAVTRVSDGLDLYFRPPEVAEEAYWLARNLPGVAVYTGPDRFASGMAAWQEFRPDLFLLDDGFQHFQLHRDLDLVLLDAESPFGNGRLLPAGPLREPLGALAAADGLILTRFQEGRHQAQLQALRQMFPEKTVLTATILPTAAQRYPEGQAAPPEALKGLSLFAFAGLARPQVFSQTLTDLAVELKGFQPFPDHYAYAAQDLEKLSQAARAREAAALITTAKDWARLGERWEQDLPLWVLEVDAHLEEAALARLFEVLGEGAEARGPWPPPPNQPLPPEVRQRFKKLKIMGRFSGDFKDVGRVLLRAPNWLGDAVMGLPVLAGVRRLFPRAELTVLAAPRVAPLFTAQPGVAQVIPYPPGWGRWRLLLGLRGRFDLALALPNSLESALGLWLAAVPDRVGYNLDARRPLLTVAVGGADGLSGLHTVYYLLGLLRAFGEVANFTPPRLYLPAAEMQAAQTRLGQAGGEGAVWVGLSPGAAYGPAKRWLPDRFAALGALLRKESGASLVLLGGPEDRPAAAQVKAQLGGPVLDLVGQTDLRQALGVLSQLKLLITNDSGLMHAAAALGVPLVALFGSSDPRATAPFTSRATVLYHPRPCSPCFKRTCEEGYPCLTDISVAEVMTAARGWLEEKLKS